MIPNPQFSKLPKSFWAAVRSISQHCGYTQKGTIKIPSLDEMRGAYVKLGLEARALDLPLRAEESMGEILSRYYVERARMLVNEAEPSLMEAEQARAEFVRLNRTTRQGCLRSDAGKRGVIDEFEELGSQYAIVTRDSVGG